MAGCDVNRFARELTAGNFRVVLNTSVPGEASGVVTIFEYTPAVAYAAAKLVKLGGPPTSITVTAKNKATLFWEYGEHPPERGELVAG